MHRCENMFSEMKLADRKLKNRIFLSPMGDGKAEADGSVSEDYIGYYEQIAKGGCAVITPGVVCVDYPYGKPVSNIARMDDAKYIHNYSIFADRIHQLGALLIPQLHHAGAQTFSMPTEGHRPRTVTDADPAHAGHLGYRALGPQKELTTEEIKVLVQKFVAAAAFCQMATCDGISLHAAHGYLISAFLSPDTNKRTDEYGGSFENRVRFAKEIVMGIRAACGPKFIIGARIPGVEFTPDGMTQEECIRVAQVLEDAGCDYFDISIGTSEDICRLIETPRFDQGNRVPYAAAVKKSLHKAKVGAVGVLREPEYCENLIKEGLVDFVSLGRALLADPEWPKKARECRFEEIRPCISCLDGCLGSIVKGLSVRCALNPTVGREGSAAAVTKADQSKRVLVIGGGVGGMQAAITAASRGHHVTIAEESDRLGGQVNLASVPPNKQRLADAKNWFVSELKRQNVEVKLKTKVDLAYVKNMKPDEIVIASGALPITPPIKGADHAIQSWDVIKGNVDLPENKEVVIIGGGIVGCETAEMLIEKNNHITILEMLPAIAGGLEGSNLADLMTCFAAGGVSVNTESVVQSISPNSVTYKKDNEEQTIQSDLTILSTGMASVGEELTKELRNSGYEVTVIGDANRPRKIIDATTEGFFVGKLL